MLGGDNEKAQDFLQNIFLKIVENPDSFHNGKPFSNWIFTIAHNMCKNEYRRLSRTQIENYSNLDNVCFDEKQQGNFDKIVDQLEFKKALYIEINKLSTEQRSTFLLRFQENFSIKEIKNILACSEGTIKSRLFNITRRLAYQLKDYNPYKSEVQ